MAPKSILVTGASGYIGGTFLATFLDGSNEWVNHYQVSVLVRTKGQADFARANNITPVLFEHVRRLGASDQDRHRPYWSRMASRQIPHLWTREETKDLGQKVHFLSISGTSNFSDRQVTGKFIDNRVKSDEEDMYSCEKYRESFEHYPQRTTDVTIVEHGERAGMSTYIVIPPIIHGIGRGEFNKFTFQLPIMVQAAKKCSSVAMIGEGTSIYDHVHVEDIASLLNTLLARIHDGQDIPSGKRGIYFCESGEHTVLKERGAIESDEVKSLDLQAVADLYLPGLPLTLVELPFAGK
ncbi:unnamed protein product [Clonostachys chloroleuca]|uniref:NAD-dependent epimerase/dehydratase domain-containing protein n=1 Tax=Clonostachys chloroleuca TaxID=1926264 RepID=A0AA35LNT2_9HYPO|nr:unnamed protein product [Clonostachys chloroleuca]